MQKKNTHTRNNARLIIIISHKAHSHSRRGLMNSCVHVCAHLIYFYILLSRFTLRHVPPLFAQPPLPVPPPPPPQRIMVNHACAARDELLCTIAYDLHAHTHTHMLVLLSFRVLLLTHGATRHVPYTHDGLKEHHYHRHCSLSLSLSLSLSFLRHHATTRTTSSLICDSCIVAVVVTTTTVVLSCSIPL